MKITLTLAIALTFFLTSCIIQIKPFDLRPTEGKWIVNYSNTSEIHLNISQSFEFIHDPYNIENVDMKINNSYIIPLKLITKNTSSRDNLTCHDNGKATLFANTAPKPWPAIGNHNGTGSDPHFLRVYVYQYGRKKHACIYWDHELKIKKGIFYGPSDKHEGVAHTHSLQ